MPEVVALFRYPVKGLTPEACETLDVQAGVGVLGDRVLGLRFADDPTPDDEWSRKAGMLVLMNTPGLARLSVSFDQHARRLHVSCDGAVLVDESIDGAGRDRIAAAIQEFALGLEETPLRDNPRHLPIRLVGDGRTPRFRDSSTSDVSLHGRGSLRALADSFNDPEFDEMRFRSNVVVEGLEAWEELDWQGKAVRIGDDVFDVSKAKVRCLATEANPITGVRDRNVLTTLTRAFSQEDPTFAISLTPRESGRLHLGDAVEVLLVPSDAPAFRRGH